MHFSFTKQKIKALPQGSVFSRIRAKASFLFLLLSLLFASGLWAQTITVKGKITNETGDPVPGASILVKGSTQGVNSSDNGSFEIKAPPKGTLVVSSVGYLPREIKIGNQTTLNIQLTSANKEMDQVVVIGYGEQKAQGCNQRYFIIESRRFQGLAGNRYRPDAAG
jgi:hypothetical protein